MGRPETPAAAVAVLRDVMVPMRDGIRLATDITLPARAGKPLPGPFPTLLYRTPYGKTLARQSEISVRRPEPKPNPEIAADLARAGYAVMMQDCRGRYGSEGGFRKYLGEGEDGFDTLAWAAAQPWCDGRFGTFGLSYSAHVQTALAALGPPGLKAMFLDSGGFWNAWQGGVRRGGAFELKQLTWAMKHAALSPLAAADPQVARALAAEDIGGWFAALLGGMPWRPGHSPLRHVPEYEDYILEQWRQGTFDAFWQVPELHAEPHYPVLARAAVFLICGWFDPYSETMFRHFQGLTAAGGHAELVMGPWLHGRRSQTFAGEVDFGDASRLDDLIAGDYDRLRRDWFDRWLKPERPEPAPPRLRWFAMGGGTGRRDAHGRRQHGGIWREDRAWPLPASTVRAFHLAADGILSDRPAGGSVLLQTDPRHPVPSRGGQITSGEPLMQGGAFDQVATPAVFAATPPFLPLAARPDVLTFSTPPLPAAIEIAGAVVVHLALESDVPDADITVKLVHWMPPNADWPAGFAMNLTDGILRLRYRDDPSVPRMLRKGEVVRVRIEAPPVAARFPAGHRIRLDIAGSNFPRFDINPQSGEPEGLARSHRVATTALHLAGSRLELALLPALRP
ncbi:MAG: CocE/NonD family hydrolase [Rhodobacteraceae bacterium]|nr:CocE/NonD family hydrolase [Paracoccaceae bacterium]